MEKQTAMPIVAGVLNIVHAVFGLLCLLGLIIAIITITSAGTAFPYHMWGAQAVPLAVLWGIAIPCAVSSVLSLLGGIYALQRKKWGLALAGSIAAIYPTFVVGTVAVILVALSKNEFE